jgi:hypothetical protein
MVRPVQLHTKLKKGDIIDIYTDYQDELNYEGKAELIERVRPGDSFFLKDEKIIPEDKKEYSKKDLAAIHKFNRLENLLKSKNTHIQCKKLYKKLVAERNYELDDYERIKSVIKDYRDLYTNSIHKIGCVMREYDDYYLYRYIHQDKKNWQPSLFSYERWVVRFIEDSTGWKVDWTTQRNIRILKLVNPKQQVLVENTTYDNGIPSKKREKVEDLPKYLKRRQRRLNNKLRLESLLIDDEEDDEDNDFYDEEE